MSKEVDLEGMPPIKKVRKPRAKKHHTTKNVPVEVSIRRQVSEDIGDDEPTKDEKYVLLQKYGVVAPKIDRLVTKPTWMGVSEWNHKQNEWFRATKGLVNPAQRSKNFRPSTNSQQPPRVILDKNGKPLARTFSPRPHRPWKSIQHKRDSRLNSGTTQTATPQS
jgi:hypothetical protein